MRLFYNDFVAERPEPTTLLELWCLIGGIITIIFVIADAGVGFSGRPKLETILALIFPAFTFFLNYLSNDYKFFGNLLIPSTAFFLGISIYLLFFPPIAYKALPSSDIALALFNLVSLLLLLTKKFRQ